MPEKPPANQIEWQKPEFVTVASLIGLGVVALFVEQEPVFEISAARAAKHKVGHLDQEANAFSLASKNLNDQPKAQQELQQKIAADRAKIKAIHATSPTFAGLQQFEDYVCLGGSEVILVPLLVTAVMARIRRRLGTKAATESAAEA